MCFLGGKRAPIQLAVASAALLLLQSSEANLNRIPELPPLSIQLAQQLPLREDLPRKKLLTARVKIPFIRDKNNECPTKVFKSIVTRRKHPKSSEKCKARQYICQDCYEKRKVYHNEYHHQLCVQHKSRDLAERVLGWQQTEPIVFHHMYSLPSFLGTEKVYAATFSILFATQVINLRRISKSNHFVTVKKNIGSHISNNRGPSHGGYTISGRGSSKNWKT